MFRFLAIAALVFFFVTACGSTALDPDQANGEIPTTDAVAADEAADVTSGVGAATEAVAEPIRYSELPTVTLDELPDEALATMRLIRDDGPYPYSQDGSTFQNREGILPDRDGGHYREFTVDTPGLSHRGPLRLVAGEDGALYYTDDHYDSFREVISQ